MGICYRAILMDEFDWCYAGSNKWSVVAQVKDIVPHATLETHVPYMMIFDLDKCHPDILKGKVHADAIYMMSDNQMTLVQI